ncbi:MAG: hypothetical protein L3J46_09610, partial [Kangiellaceae bacterium]|nr:hypothetical protein [Kangiellaceae bacterium]
SPGYTGGDYAGRMRINGDYCARRKNFVCRQYNPQYIFYYNYYRDIVTTQRNDYGISDLEILLDDASLSSLAEKGSISYSVSSKSGDFVFDNAVLIADVSVVPEPPAIILIGTGILLLRLPLWKNRVREQLFLI